ncbi:MAG: amine dehydrogenase large subunit, partial [Gammaproteobacteria bacterium]
PGGYQILAVHAPTKRLYVAMHDNGKEGSHKVPAKEIWAFDLATKQRVERAPGSGAVAISLTKEAKPTLYTYAGEEMSVTRYDTQPALKPVATSAQIGDTVGLIATH